MISEIRMDCKVADDTHLLMYRCFTPIRFELVKLEDSLRYGPLPMRKIFKSRTPSFWIVVIRGSEIIAERAELVNQYQSRLIVSSHTTYPGCVSAPQIATSRIDYDREAQKPCLILDLPIIQKCIALLGHMRATYAAIIRGFA